MSNPEGSAVPAVGVVLAPVHTGRKCASWLLGEYPHPIWTVTDTWDKTRTATIDFDYRLADGRSLMASDRLCATVKEYAFNLRDDRFAAIDDAKTHAQSVRNLMHLTHALTLRKLSSFTQLQPYDVEELVEECRYGLDAMLHASERVEAYLRSVATDIAAARIKGLQPANFGGLPRYVNPRTGRPTKRVSSEAIIIACHLPASAAGLPCVATLISQAALANGLEPRLTKLDGENIRPVRNVTVQAMLRSIEPLEQLYSMRRRIDAEGITFKPFAQGAARVAAVKGVGSDRTPIPPPELALHLLEKSASWIFEHCDRSIEAMEPAAVKRLATACWIVIAAFSARRDEEISDLREGCIRGDDDTGYWLHVYIEKTLQRKEWIPVPSIVAKAVRVLSVISSAAREMTGSDRLLQWCNASGHAQALTVGRYLDDFAAAVQVPMHHPRGEPAVEWHWHPHQFRRFFAILYFYRFEGANIEALSHYLRHFNIEMTRRYVTRDPEVAALWTEVEWGYMGHVARTIVAGERSIAGAAGERLKRLAHRLIDVFRRKLQIVAPERVGASLTLLMQRQGMVLTPKPWVTCSCPATFAATNRAACRQQSPAKPGAVGPDFAHAGPSVCANCPHAITEGARSAVVDAELKHLKKATACGTRASTIFGELEAVRVLELTQVRDLRYKGARPLSHAT